MYHHLDLCAVLFWRGRARGLASDGIQANVLNAVPERAVGQLVAYARAPIRHDLLIHQ